MAVIPTESEIYEFEGYSLDAVRRVLLAPDGEPIRLMPKAIDTLITLIRNRGRVLSRDELLTLVWPDTVVEENNLTQNISSLRKTFNEKPGQHRFIVTVPGQGYKFVADVIEKESEPPQPAVPVTNEESITPAVERKNDRSYIYAAAAGISLIAIAAIGFWVFKANSTANNQGSVRTIAVLPFKPLSPEMGNEAIELGMADTLINRLGASTELIVRPLNAVRRFGAPETDPQEAGRALGVDAVLDGSVQIDQGRIRVTSRLVNVATGRLIWAEEFNQEFKDPFSVQESISQRVADALKIRLVRSTQPHETESVEAYELYMRGRVHQLRLVMPEVRKGIEFFERSILADPNFARPHVGISESQRALIFSNDVDPRELIPRAKIAAARAVELAPDSAEAWASLGMNTFVYDWDWAEAEKQLSQAVQLDPRSDAHIFYAHLLSNLGRKEPALDHARRARELDPTSPIINVLEAQFLNHLGERSQALQKLNALIDMHPDFWLGHLILASALTDEGDYPGAIREALEAKRLSPLQTQADTFRAVALIRSGNREPAQEILDEFLKSEKERYVPPCNIAMIYAALGKTEKANEYLEKGFEGKDVRMVFLKIEPKWDVIRSDPGFAQMLRRMNLDN